MSQPKLERLPGVGRLVAIGSGKGGVGKTTTTISLALALAIDGYSVGIFDADVYGPNVPLMLGVRRKESAEGFLPVGRAENRAYVAPLERFGLKLMSMGLLVGEGQALVPDNFMAGLIVTRTMKDVLWGELDYLLMDLPPGTGEPQQTLLRTMAVDGAVIVTTRQQMALMDAQRSANLFNKAGVPVVGVVENMSFVVCPDCGKEIEVFSGSGANGLLDGKVPLLGRLPMDPLLSERITVEHPLVSGADSNTASIFREIASKLARALPTAR